MGICTSSQIGPGQNTEEQLMATRRAAASITSMVQVMHIDGQMEEYRRPVKAWQVVVGRPGCYLCCSDAMMVDQHVPAVPEDEELQPGLLYFLLPLSAAHRPLSLADLCRLTIIASRGMSQRRLAPPRMQRGDP